MPSVAVGGPPGLARAPSGPFPASGPLRSRAARGRAWWPRAPAGRAVVAGQAPEPGRLRGGRTEAALGLGARSRERKQ